MCKIHQQLGKKHKLTLNPLPLGMVNCSPYVNLSAPTVRWISRCYWRCRECKDSFNVHTYHRLQCSRIRFFQISKECIFNIFNGRVKKSSSKVSSWTFKMSSWLHWVIGTAEFSSSVESVASSMTIEPSHSQLRAHGCLLFCIVRLCGAFLTFF